MGYSNSSLDGHRRYLWYVHGGYSCSYAWNMFIWVRYVVRISREYGLSGLHWESGSSGYLGWNLVCNISGELGIFVHLRMIGMWFIWTWVMRPMIRVNRTVIYLRWACCLWAGNLSRDCGDEVHQKPWLATWFIRVKECGCENSPSTQSN